MLHAENCYSIIQSKIEQKYEINNDINLYMDYLKELNGASNN